ncbi:MAG: glycosyltransferase family 4 protein [Verrucomicrobia bacterium]|nr:glycosyltransferase family 4 protein [Verrucomicrobiota bacterium]MBU1910129.1 glycosyltransferase family 4 protein [Verrucomicrobiota bacterium]
MATIYTLYGRRAGAEMFIEKTLQALVGQFPDWRLTVFCNSQAEAVLRNVLPTAELEYIPWLDNQFKKAFWLEFLSFRVVGRRRFDVFWIPSGSAHFPGRWNVPSVITFLDMGTFLVKDQYDFKRTVYRKYLATPRSIRRGVAFTGISRTTVDNLITLFPRVKQASVIYPGPSPFPPPAPMDDPAGVIEKEIGLKTGPILFSPARTDYWGKGRDILLKAYAGYRRQSAEPLPLIMPGPQGEFHDTVMRDIAALGLDGYAIWPGRVSDACIEALYRVSRAMIMPSRIEGFGFPILEAMTRGVPVICSDAGSLPEVAGGAALVFPSGNAERLEEAMVRLDRTPALREDLIRKGRERCRLFSWEHAARQYGEVFRQAAGR